MCPHPFFTVMGEAKEARHLRLRMVQHGKAVGGRGKVAS